MSGVELDAMVTIVGMISVSCVLGIWVKAYWGKKD